MVKIDPCNAISHVMAHMNVTMALNKGLLYSMYCRNIPSSKENIPISKTAMFKSYYDPASQIICMLPHLYCAFTIVSRS